MHLLLVEDDLRLSEYIREALSREGHTIEICQSVDEADAYT
jgi:DNA-binding response OmpR family regulator